VAGEGRPGHERAGVDWEGIGVVLARRRRRASGVVAGSPRPKGWDARASVSNSIPRRLVPLRRTPALRADSPPPAPRHCPAAPLRHPRLKRKAFGMTN